MPVEFAREIVVDRTGMPEPESPPSIFVARQPILNKRMEVYGYELLYRSGMRSSFDNTNAQQATSDVITASFLSIGIDKLVGKARAFINFDRELLLSPLPLALPKERVVIEILESVVVDNEVVSRCRELKQAGFQIALDDFRYQNGLETLIPLADIIKVDFRETPVEEQGKLAAEFSRLGKRILAEKVETHEEYGSASETGYTYFQGYFFATPTTVQSSRVNPSKFSYFKLIEETAHAELDWKRIEDLLKREPTLTAQLLRYLNSAIFCWNDRIRSIRHALALLGTVEFRKWSSIVTLCGLGQERPRELIACSVIRGRFCELAGSKLGLAHRASELFLMGLFSMLDVIMNQPLHSVLPGLHLPADINDVLLRREGKSTLEQLYVLSQTVERGDCLGTAVICVEMNLSEAEVAHTYLDAVEWANQFWS